MLLTLLKKEFYLIGRSLGGIISLFTLSVSVVFIFYTSIEVNEILSARSIRGIKWAIIFLLNFVIVSQSLWEERESMGWEASLSFVSPISLYLTKSLAIWFCTILVNGALVLVLSVFFQNMSIERFWGEWLFANLGSGSLVFLGVSLGLIAFESRLKEIIIPLLQLPFSIPLFLFGLEAEHRYWLEPGFYLPSVGLLLFFMLFYATLGSVMIEILRNEH
ncbi:heme exporter protein CcmB [Leptospira sp. 2 VSF19]|uniref:Heme exporter protein CcmB n=1 Tax=Leptospira soteropolitanensis TaxID=2950025 RepID=A0AAW5VHN9_9LEPT|nr:heme exporter protein CcmB [Leptospira soteropolitanensis]MCW7493264.1 heme exporter protein CcmB [Leptospira soteropolitanensis]MCW7500667.1 heme exporter protein CcmB [Leptospira soteropolitanensis]MCW7523114.1 heme exporter protein CcmB [Leptospira soteropolitanensis]MCW7526779.1 heme exporter protein CcmB [Leptospira soteropolitanensis]MCW7530832.1 heme exporter protein CcmB [Leptospira soteropolitanensis]